MADNDDDTSDRAFDDPNTFRNAAAGLIKSLIRARARQQPNFLEQDDYRRWGLTDLALENRSCATLLRQVRNLHEKFLEQLTDGLNSIPEPTAGEAANLVDTLAEQVTCFFRGDLGAAIQAAERSKEIPWNELADWKQLSALRDGLDRLPSLPPKGPAQSTRQVAVPIIRRSKRNATIEWNHTLHEVDEPTAQAFEAMIAAKGQPVGIGKIVRKGNEWLKDLQETRQELASIVVRAEGNRGYRLVIFDSTAESA